MKDVIRSGIKTPAYFIHHKDYVTDKNYNNDNVFYNLDNLESLCFNCHQEEHFGSKEEYGFDENGDLIKNE